MFSLERVKNAIAAIQRGEIIVVSDDQKRENESDLVMAGEKATPEMINMMLTHGRGLVCVSLTSPRAKQLALWKMVSSQDRFQTAFTISVDAKTKTTTGISAFDRAHTIKLLTDPKATQADFYRPGHVFPLIAEDSGVLSRPGHTEAAADLARLAGCQPIGVLCEIIANNGQMAQGKPLEKFIKKHQLLQIHISDLIRYRKIHDHLIEPSGKVELPSRFSPDSFILHAYRSLVDQQEHVALVFGKINPKQFVLVRIHSECLTGDVFHSQRCDCGEQMEQSLQAIVETGNGICIYLRQEGRGIGLINKIKAYILQDKHGFDTVDANLQLGFPADSRDYSIAGQILRYFKLKKIRLLTNNPSKIKQLEEFDLTVERAPLIIPVPDCAKGYLQTKKERLGHLLL